MKQGGVYPTTQQSINSSLGASAAMPNATVANSSRVNSRRMPGSSGRHSSMHEYVQNGITGLNTTGAQLGTGPPTGQGQFTQITNNTGQNFQDIINSSQKVSVPNPNSSLMLNQVAGNQKKFIQQQQPNHSKIFQQAPGSQGKKNMQSNSYTAQKNKRVLQTGTVGQGSSGSGVATGGSSGATVNQSIQGNAVNMKQLGLQNSVQRGSRVGSLLQHDNSINSQTSQGPATQISNGSKPQGSNYGHVKRQQSSGGSGTIRSSQK